MTENPNAARHDLVVKLHELFRQRGYEGVSIGDISIATGLGKSSLYHHFPGGKEEMAEAVIAFTRTALERDVFAPLRSDGDATTRIGAMLAAVGRIYSGGATPCVLAALLSTAADSPLARGTAQIFADWKDAIAATVEELGVRPVEAQRRARAALSLLQGALVMTRALKDPVAFREAIAMAHDTLIADGEIH
jgi:AcrR family transcriptional regulator